MRYFLLFFLLPVIACAQPPQSQSQHQSRSKKEVYSFSFNLPVSAKVSAGVYQGNYLVRTIFSNRSFTPGEHTEYWDGLDDEMNEVQPVNGLQVKLLYNNVKYEWEGVIGNTSKSKSGPTVHFGFNSFKYLVIGGNRAYYSKGYSEGNPGQAFFNLNSIQEKTIMFAGEGQKTSQNTEVICSDGVNVYWGGHDPNAPRYATSLGKGNFNFIFATKISDNSETGFAKGASFKTGTGRTYKSVIDNVNNANGFITGMAVQRKSNLLFVARAAINQIDVLDKNSGALISIIHSIDKPGSLAVDNNDNLWVSESGNSIKKYKADASGNISELLSVNNLLQPMAIAVSPDNKTVVVADAGKSQQLKAFNNSTGKPEWIFGQAGGYFESATVADDKFYWTDLRDKYGCSISFEKDGSFWVIDGGNCRAQHYDANRKFIERIMFLPHLYEVFVDPKVPGRVFGEFMEFAVDYSKPLLPDNGSWKLVKNWGANITGNLYNQYNAFKPVLFSNGKTFSLLPNRDAKTYDLVELTKENKLRMAGSGVATAFQYLNTDGDLYTLPKRMDGAAYELQKSPLTGFNSQGEPVWGAVQTMAKIGRLAADDPAFSGDNNSFTGGQMTSNKQLIVFDATKNEGFHIGGVKPGSDKWSWRSARSTFREYSGSYPNDGYYDIGNMVKNAGITAVVADSNVFWGYKGEFWKNLQTNFWQHMHQDGLMVGLFGNVRTRDVENVQPAESGNAVNGCVVKVGNDYYLYHGEEGTHSGIHRWKISNTSSIKIISVPIATATGKAQGRAVSAATNSSSAGDNASGWKRYPASDDLTDKYKKLWKVTAGEKSYNKFSDPDLTVRFRQESKMDAYVVKEINSRRTEAWNFNCDIDYEGNNAAAEFDKSGNNTLGGQYLEILDNRGKIILRFYPQLDYASKIMKLVVNGVTIKEASEKEMDKYLQNFQSLEVSAGNGKINFSYADFATKNIKVFDESADVNNPASVRLYFYSNGRSYDKVVSIKNVEFR